MSDDLFRPAPSAARNGAADLHVEASGRGTPFVWGHALFSSIAAEDAGGLFGWEAPPPGVELLRYDARGHGRSAAPADPAAYRWPALGADMLAVADRGGAGRFIAGGMSLGSVSAIHAALQAPTRVGALVLVSPPRLWEQRMAHAAVYQRQIRAVGMLGGAWMAALLHQKLGEACPDWMDAAQRVQLQAGASAMPAMADATLLALYGAAAACNLPPRAALAPLARTPVLILGWEGDDTHPVSAAEQLHQQLPASTLRIARSHAEFAALAQHLKAFVGACA